MPQAADFPISMRRSKHDGSAEHVYANSQQEWEGLQAAGFTQESIRVQWPKLLRFPDGKEVTVMNEDELKSRQKEGYGFPRDVPRPEQKAEPKMVSAEEVAAMQKEFQQQLADLNTKFALLSGANKAIPPSPTKKPEL